jgi:accessory gene regulator B
MEYLAKKIAGSIGESLGKSEEDVAVMAYGLIGILQFLAIFALASMIGVVLGFWLEVLVVFLSVGFLRRLTGGAHSSGIYSCLVYSIMFICGLSALARYLLPVLPLSVNCAICILIFAFGYFMVARKAPVAPPNKPCRTEAKRRRLRRGAFIVLSVFGVLVGMSLVLHENAARVYSLGLALALSTFWQIAMMTRVGHAFISMIDKLFISNIK